MKPERFGREIYEAESYLHLEDQKRMHKAMMGEEPLVSDISGWIEYAAGTALVTALTDIAVDGMEPDISSIVISIDPELDGVYDVHAVVDAYPLEPVAENDCE